MNNFVTIYALRNMGENISNAEELMLAKKTGAQDWHECYSGLEAELACNVTCQRQYHPTKKCLEKNNLAGCILRNNDMCSETCTPDICKHIYKTCDNIQDELPY